MKWFRLIYPSKWKSQEVYRQWSRWKHWEDTFEQKEHPDLSKALRRSQKKRRKHQTEKIT